MEARVRGLRGPPHSRVVLVATQFRYRPASAQWCCDWVTVSGPAVVLHVKPASGPSTCTASAATGTEMPQRVAATFAATPRFTSLRIETSPVLTFTSPV